MPALLLLCAASPVRLHAPPPADLVPTHDPHRHQRPRVAGPPTGCCRPGLPAQRQLRPATENTLAAMLREAPAPVPSQPPGTLPPAARGVLLVAGPKRVGHRRSV